MNQVYHATLGSFLGAVRAAHAAGEVLTRVDDAKALRLGVWTGAVIHTVSLVVAKDAEMEGFKGCDLTAEQWRGFVFQRDPVSLCR